MVPFSLWQSALLAVTAAITLSGSSHEDCPAASCPRDSLAQEIDALERQVPYLQKVLPPPELFPSCLNDVPTLTQATSTSLRFQLNIAQKNGLCPSYIVWTYKAMKGGKSETQRTDSFTLENNVCKISIQLKRLEPETVYMLQAQPMKLNLNEKYWYSKEDTPTLWNSYPAFARTCSNKVPGISAPQVHSVGSNWLGLSWIPPKFDCVAELEYRVRHSSKNKKSSGYEEMGSFQSNNLQKVGGSVSPCVAWPDRHCLFLAIDTRSGWSVAIQVRRMTDLQESLPMIVNFSSSINTDIPGPPRRLRVVEAGATSLVLRWASPLVLGRRLDKVVIRVRSSDGRVTELPPTSITLCPEYEKTVENLEENTEYTVYVWFTSTTGKDGYNASLEVRTLPQPTTTIPPTTTITTSTSPEKPTSSMEVSMCMSSPLPHQLLSVQNEDKNQWIWVAACSVLLVLVFVAFFAGRRCGTQKQWKSSRLEETQSCYGTGKKGAGGRDGDRAVLCAAGAGAGVCTPPTSARDYAEVEVDLSTGRAWAGVVRPSNLYEELCGSEKHYANVGAPGETPQAYYAEVGAPPPLPPPAAAPAPAPALTPVYAEVDLEKKHAQRKK